MLVKAKARGFTLTEMLITIAILAIIGVFAVPSFRGIMATSRIKTTASDIHLSLVRARSEAIKRNINITVSAPGGWKAGWTTSNGIETHNAIAGDALTITGTTTITYTPNGRATANPIKISLTSTESTVKRCVSVSLSGHPVVKQEACA